MNSSELRMDVPRKAGWLVSGIVFAALAISFLFGSFYVVDTGHVGVERTLGKVDLVESEPGMNFKLPLLTQAYEFSAKEIALDLDDLKPKAADNLSLQDLDVTVYYNASPDAIADLMVKYANASQYAPGAILPAYGIVYREARGAVYEEIAKIDSLELHKLRDALQTSIQDSLTAQYLQHEINVALQSFAENEGQLVVMPANMQGFDVILDTQRFPTNDGNQ